MTRNYLSGSIKKALAIIECVGKSPKPLKASQVSSITKLDRATAFRILTYLTSLGYIFKDTSNNLYSLGHKIFEFGDKSDFLKSLTTLCFEHIKNLSPYVAGKRIEEVKKQFNLKSVIKLASNENPFGPSPLAIERVKNTLNITNRYPDSSGYDLRSLLAEKHMVNIDNVIIGNGSEGIMSAAIAEHVGARNVLISDINDERLKLAQKVCNAETFNPTKENLKEKMQSMGLKEGFDIGLEMSGSEAALDQMIDAMIMGGKVALLGIPPEKINFDLSKVIFKALTLKAIYGREVFETWYKGLALLDSGLDIKNIITHTFHYTEFEEAFNLLNSGKAGKVVLNWH